MVCSFRGHQNSIAGVPGKRFTTESGCLYYILDLVEGHSSCRRVWVENLCLTDLARAGWDLHEIARFAGHRNLETTQQYIHLSCSDLAHKLSQGMHQIHDWRLRVLSKAFLGSEGLQ